MKKLLSTLGLTLIITTIPAPAKAGVVWYPLPEEAYGLGKIYPEAQRLLFAFDYGHALVYERLLGFKRRGEQVPDPEKLEKEILTEIMKILRNPPNVKVEEAEIAPSYVFTFPLTVDIFDWSHLLHQFVLDILAVSEDRGQRMIDRVTEIDRQYKSNRPVVITDVCKTMLFMDGHYFSKAFRRSYPSFNLLIWSYHWFQIRLYEDLLKSTRAERDQAVAITIKKFWDLISDLPDSAEFDMMPETEKEAPTFFRLFPKISASFDTNHMLHDIISDILTSERVPSSQLRPEGLRTARMAQDPAAFAAPRCQN